MILTALHLLVPVALLILAFFATGFWEYKQIQNRRWASEEALPQFEKLSPIKNPWLRFRW